MRTFSIVASLFFLVTSCSTMPNRDTASTVGARAADAKAFEELGFAHASQRFVQMDILRRAVSGRLAELFGETKLEQDKRSYAIGLAEVLPQMEKKIAMQYPEVYALLEAYSRGVNRVRENEGLLKIYRVGIAKDAKYVPDAWKPIDSIAVNVALSFGLSNALEETLALGSIYRAVYAAKGNPQGFADFFDARPIEPFTPMPHGKTAEAPTVDFKIAAGALPPSYVCHELDYPYTCGKAAPGSNQWAVNAKRIEPGQKVAALLASDPHLPMQAPSFYFETTIDSARDGGTFNVTGESIPGIPGIQIGHNDKVAWGVTNSMAHIDSVYLETLSADGNSVKFKEAWVPVVRNEYSISVREPNAGMRTEKIVVRNVPHHGNLFSEHLKELKGLAPNTALSYRWPGFEEGGSTDIVATLMIDRAANFEDMKKGVALNWTGAGNYVYADTAGNIGYTQHGRQPLRANLSVSTPPYVPLPGEGNFEWTGFRSEFPEAYNPASGYIVVVNDDPWGRNLEKHFSDFKDYFSFKSTDGCRGKRIRDMIEAKGNHLTADDMKRMQFDHMDLMAHRLVEELLKPIAKKGGLKGSAAGTMLVKWDGEMAKEKKEPLVYAAWLATMMARHFADVIPLGVFPTIGETPAGIQTLYHKLTDRFASDRKGTTKWVRETLAEAETQLKKTSRWGQTWGENHRLTMSSSVGGAPTIGPARDGSWLTVDVAGYQGLAKRDGSMPDSFGDTYGANFRMVNELADAGAIKTYAVLPGGMPDDEKRYVEGTFRETKPLMMSTKAKTDVVGQQ